MVVRCRRNFEFRPVYRDGHAAGGFARCRRVESCRCGFVGSPALGYRYFQGMAWDVVYNVRLITYREESR